MLPSSTLAMFFTTKGRLSRIPYFLLWAALTLAGGALQSVVWVFSLVGPWSLALLLGLLSIALSLVLLVGGFCIATRRWHDMGKSGWWNLLLFIPGINFLTLLALFVIPGQPGVNGYDGLFANTQPARVVRPARRAKKLPFKKSTQKRIRR